MNVEKCCGIICSIKDYNNKERIFFKILLRILSQWKGCVLLPKGKQLLSIQESIQ